MANMAKLLDKQYEEMDFDELVKAPVEAIAGISAGDAEILKKAFNVATIGDLGTNKYIVAAVAIAALSRGNGWTQPNGHDHMNHDDHISRHIEPDRHHLGPAEARLAESGVHVWAIAGYGPLVDWDAARIAADYGISLDEAEAGLAYYRRHRDAIEARIAANDSSAVQR